MKKIALLFFLLSIIFIASCTSKVKVPECDNIQNEYDKDECYYDVAVEEQDPTICDKIQNQELRDGCYDYVADERQDPTICDKIQDQEDRDWCYIFSNEEKQDPSVCGKIKKQNYKRAFYINTFYYLILGLVYNLTYG